MQPTINLVLELRLHEARRAVLYRGPAGGEETAIQDIERRRFDSDYRRRARPHHSDWEHLTCETIYRLDFDVLRGVETIRFFCPNDWYRIGGPQEIWGGTQGASTDALLNSVAPFFANQPIPQIPTFTPDE